MIRTARLLLVLALACPALASAYTGPRHVAREKRELDDSLRDEKRVQKLLKDFQRTRSSRKAGLAVEARVAAALDAELSEARQHVREQATEVERDRLKVREDKREGMNTWEHQDPPTTAGDKHSLADDRRDMMKEVEFRDRLRVVRVEWHELEGDRHRRAMKRKQQLIEELLRLSRFQIQADAQEVQEGRQELHERR